jgi:hypothetical protein
MSYSLFKILHLGGVFMVLVSLGGLIVLGVVEDSRWRKLAGMTNGIGLVVAFVGGLGLLGQLELVWPWPGWILAKVLIWLVFAVLMVLAKRASRLGSALWWGSVVLAAVAAALANLKPF